MRATLGDTERARETYTTPPSAARSARCVPAGASLPTSTAAPEALHRSGTLSRSGTTRWRTREEKGPIASPCRVMRCCPSILFSPPGNGFPTLDARWKLLISQYTSGIIRGDTVGLCSPAPIAHTLQQVPRRCPSVRLSPLGISSWSAPRRGVVFFLPAPGFRWSEER
jgi:hypothetical protein